MKAFELSFNLIALFIMGLLIVVLAAGHFTGQSSQIFSRISGFGKGATEETAGVAANVCVELGKCIFAVGDEDYVDLDAARKACNEVENRYGRGCKEMPEGKPTRVEWTPQ